MATPERGFSVEDTNEMSYVNDPDTVVMVGMLSSKCPALTSVLTHKVPSCVLHESDYPGSFICYVYQISLHLETCGNVILCAR